MSSENESLGNIDDRMATINDFLNNPINRVKKINPIRAQAKTNIFDYIKETYNPRRNYGTNEGRSHLSDMKSSNISALKMSRKPSAYHCVAIEQDPSEYITSYIIATKPIIINVTNTGIAT